MRSREDCESSRADSSAVNMSFKGAEMHLDAILRVTAILRADADAKLTTDKHRLVDDLHLEYLHVYQKATT